MEFLPIFAHIYKPEDCHLWAVKYPGEQRDELDRLLALWTDPMLVREFLKENIEDLQREFWKGLTVRDAALKIYQEATVFEDELLKIEEEAQENDYNLLNELFKPLNDYEYAIKLPQELKGKPPHNPPLTRIYALKLEDNRLLITGGGIKLTHKMKESNSLKDELVKINNVKNYLKQKQITYLDGDE